MTPQTGVQLAGLTKTYEAVRAVDDLHLAIAPGEVVALLGPNGAGKSTTIDMLLGLTQPDHGTVRLWGEPPHRACAQGRVGAMLQNGGLLGAVTVREIIELMRALSPDPLALGEVVEMARVADIIDARADRLSGGQTQRVRFAMAVSGNPTLLVLDEPTVAMDVATRRGFWSAMHDWTDRGRTVLFATHYLEEADAYADRIVLMARGRVVADGPTNEVKGMVGGRTIRATVPGAALADLERLAGVSKVEPRGEAVSLRCTDSDAALRALLADYPQARDIEVAGAGLEDAFLALTDSPPTEDVTTATGSTRPTVASAATELERTR